MPTDAAEPAGRRGASPRGATGRSRDRILDASEILFARHGYEGCSFRLIADAAEVNQGLLHYHFATKENLFAEVFLRRALPLVERRLARLDAAERAADGGPVPVETLVRGFIEPPLRMLQGEPGDRAFVRIHAQLRATPTDFGLDLRRRAFGTSTARYVAAMAHACPHLSPAAVSWRFNSMVGAYLVVVTQSGRLEDLSGGACSADDIDAALRHLVAFLVGGFAAPEPG